jgi:hypothetical protein
MGTHTHTHTGHTVRRERLSQETHHCPWPAPAARTKGRKLIRATIRMTHDHQLPLQGRACGPGQLEACPTPWAPLDARGTASGGSFELEDCVIQNKWGLGIITRGAHRTQCVCMYCAHVQVYIATPACTFVCILVRLCM